MAFPERLTEWAQAQRMRDTMGDLAWSVQLRLEVHPQRQISAQVLERLASGAETAGKSLPQALLEELIELDYLHADGRLTEPGLWAQAVLDPGNFTSLRLSARDHAGFRSLVIGFDHEQVMVFSSERSESDAPDAEWGLSYLGSELLPELITRWIPLGPAHSVDVIDRRVSDTEIDAAVSRTEAGDATGLSYVDALLTQPWQQWIMQFGMAQPNEYIAISGWGICEATRTEDGVELEVMPSAEFILLLIAGIREALEFTAEQ